MGTFTTGGIAAELEKFDGLIKGTDEACMKAVKAGGDVLAARLKEAAPVYSGSRRDVKPGALRDSIRAGKPNYNAADGFHSKVEPVGKDHGEPLAKIGNILEYGEDLKEWFHCIDVDLNGAFRLCYLVGKIMREKGKGKVINVTSNSGEMCNIPSFTPYNVAKAGLNRLTKCLAWEWGPYHINVNAIAPGYTHSNLSSEAPKEVAEMLTRNIPYGRYGEPIEIGALAVYLASDASDIMTGAVLTIDGGYSLAR